MVTEAVRKIEEEIKSVNNPYVKVIGEFLIKQLDFNPGSAEKILSKDKSIVKSLDEMRKAAEKKKVGNMAILSDEEGFGIVLNYFGINTKKVEIKEIKQPVEQTKEDIDFEINLDEYLK